MAPRSGRARAVPGTGYGSGDYCVRMRENYQYGVRSCDIVTMHGHTMCKLTRLVKLSHNLLK